MDILIIQPIETNKILMDGEKFNPGTKVLAERKEGFRILVRVKHWDNQEKAFKIIQAIKYNLFVAELFCQLKWMQITDSKFFTKYTLLLV